MGVVSASRRAGVITLKASSSPFVRILGSGKLGEEIKVVLRPWMTERVTQVGWDTIQQLLSSGKKKERRTVYRGANKLGRVDIIDLVSD